MKGMFDNMKEPIGVFDSGLGGISVLAQMIISLPQEKFLYFGDSLNAPYGEKTREEVLSFSMRISNKLIDRGSKALVVACNTATSAAIINLRNTFHLPVIGMEPAVKPAVNMKNIQRVVVMATPFTLKEKKFHELVQNIDTDKEILELPCPGLVQLIEQEGGVGPKVHAYLVQLFESRSLGKGDVLVLGCTHYVFLTDLIEKILYNQVPLVHGNVGTVSELKNQLKRNQILASEDINPHDEKSEYDLLNPFTKAQLQKRVQLMNSHPDMVFDKLGWNLLLYELEQLSKNSI